MKQENMKKNVLWNTVGSIFYCMCQWLITVLVVRIDSFEASGLLSLAMTTSSSFSAISLFNMRQFQASDVNEEYSSKEYFGSRILTCITAQAACMLYAAVTSNSMSGYWCIVLFMLVRLAEAFVDVFHGINQKFDRYDIIGKSYIARGILTIVAFTTGLIFTKSLVVALTVVAVLNLLVAFTYDFSSTGKLENIRPIISRRVLRLLATCIPLVIFSFLLSLENLIPKNLLESVHGVEELGIYASIASPTLVVQVMASVAFAPFLPQFIKLYVDGEIKAFRAMFHKILLALLGLALVIIAGAALCGRLGLTVLFGKDILEYYYLFMPIVLCTILTAVIWILSSIVTAMRKIKSLLIGIIVDFGLCLCIARPLVERYDKNGVSIVQIISYSVFVIYMVIVCEISINRAQKLRNQ